jgi:hypothetical protein
MTGDNMRQVFEAMLPQEELKCPYVQFKRWFDEPLQRLMEARVDPPLKSAPRFDQVGAESPFSMITLLHASLVASIIAALLAHAYRLTSPDPVGSIRGRTSQIRVFSQC